MRISLSDGNRRVGSVLIALVMVLLTGSAAFARVWSPEYEKQIGKQALDEVKRQYKLWENPESSQRVQDIVNTLRAVSPRPDVEYQIFLLDTKEENAFSIPGGYICVTRALLDNVQSTDELAAVLAHEMAHNCTYDALNEAQRAQELTLPVLAAVIATMVTGKGNSAAAGNVMTAGMVVTQGILSTYSIEVERKADEHGLDYLMKAGKYNPVGMLTFMERLAARERGGPALNAGIYQTHPLSTERVDAIHEALVRSGLEINRRAVTKWDPPQITAGKVGAKDAQVFSLWGNQLLVFDWAPEGTTVEQRGQAMVKSLSDLLAAGVEGWEFATVDRGGLVSLEARGQTVLTVYPQDASLNGQTAADLARLAERGLDSAFWMERLKRRY